MFWINLFLGFIAVFSFLGILILLVIWRAILGKSKIDLYSLDVMKRSKKATENLEKELSLNNRLLASFDGNLDRLLKGFSELPDGIKSKIEEALRKDK
jgi:hypothetical protein